MNVADHAGSQWLTCFQETGMEILGKSADELGELRDQVRERERGRETNLFRASSFGHNFCILQVIENRRWRMRFRKTAIE